MHLRQISIQDFRGIAGLDLELGRDTVVVGENNHGKTSLLDVLHRCLGPAGDGEAPAWEYRDFRRGPGGIVGPIRVVLAFEPAPGQTAPTLDERLFAAASSEGPDGARHVRLQFTGEPGSGAMGVRLVDAEGTPLELPAHDAIVSRLRQLHPVLLIRLAQLPQDDPLEWASQSVTRDFDASDGDDAEEVITKVYHRLLRTRGRIPTGEIRRGLQAARHLGVGGGSEGDKPGRGAVRRMLERFEEGASSAQGGRHSAGSGAHSLGLLMVLGALLEARGTAAMDADAAPLIAIEEPEVHLHPMLLSSAWHVIQGLQAQTLVTTNSGELLSEIPLVNVRRLVRSGGRIHAYRLREGTLAPDALRRVAYHVRAKRGVTLFARCWILVEGETEFWLLNELAAILGYDLNAEGVRCVEFAQCGVAPLVRLANDLGIRWHLLSDGDESGVGFADDAVRQMEGRRRRDHVTRLPRRDVEMLLWDEGFADVYLRAAGMNGAAGEGGDAPPNPKKVVARAVRAHSKPYLALMVAEECARRGPGSVPGPLRHVIETAVRLARSAVDGEG
jgi:putative ATP-dependent endonuclease of OLD family